MGNCFSSILNKNIEQPSEQPSEQPFTSKLTIEPFTNKLTIEIPNESNENNAIPYVN